MKLQTVLFWGAVAGAAYLLLRKSNGETGKSADVVHVVEETLHKHEGEDNPIVHAFEQALEHKHSDGS